MSTGGLWRTLVLTLVWVLLGTDGVAAISAQPAPGSSASAPTDALGSKPRSLAAPPTGGGASQSGVQREYVGPQTTGLHREDVQATLLNYGQLRYGCCCLRVDIGSSEPTHGGGPCTPFPPTENEQGEAPPLTWPYLLASDAPTWCPDEGSVVIPTTTSSPPLSTKSADALPSLRTPSAVPAAAAAGSKVPTAVSAANSGNAAGAGSAAATGSAAAFLDLGIQQTSNLRHSLRDEPIASLGSSESVCKFYPGLGGPPQGIDGHGDCSKDCYSLTTPEQKYSAVLKGVAGILHDDAKTMRSTGAFDTPGVLIPGLPQAAIHYQAVQSSPTAKPSQV